MIKFATNIRDAVISRLSKATVANTTSSGLIWASISPTFNTSVRSTNIYSISACANTSCQIRRRIRASWTLSTYSLPSWISCKTNTSIVAPNLTVFTSGDTITASWIKSKSKWAITSILSSVRLWIWWAFFTLSVQNISIADTAIALRNITSRTLYLSNTSFSIKIEILIRPITNTGRLFRIRSWSWGTKKASSI